MFTGRSIVMVGPWLVEAPGWFIASVALGAAVAGRFDQKLALSTIRRPSPPPPLSDVAGALMETPTRQHYAAAAVTTLKT